MHASGPQAKPYRPPFTSVSHNHLHRPSKPVQQSQPTRQQPALPAHSPSLSPPSCARFTAQTASHKVFCGHTGEVTSRQGLLLTHPITRSAAGACRVRPPVPTDLHIRRTRPRACFTLHDHRPSEPAQQPQRPTCASRQLASSCFNLRFPSTRHASYCFTAQSRATRTGFTRMIRWPRARPAGRT